MIKNQTAVLRGGRFVFGFTLRNHMLAAWIASFRDQCRNRNSYPQPFAAGMRHENFTARR
jgi:hypothetical protein